MVKLREDREMHVALLEKENESDESAVCEVFSFDNLRIAWMIMMSFTQWINIILTPIVLLWPDLFPHPDIMLWIVEILFMLDMIRKSMVAKPKSFAKDTYDIFVEYAKSNMILDLMATMP